MRDFFRFLAGLIVLLATGVVQAQNWQPEWSTATLSQSRDDLAAVAAGNDVFFAGGYTYNSGTGGAFSNVVDIYNMSTNTWSTATLSLGRSGLAAATAGNDVVFAGGDNGGLSNVVDIYNTSTRSWSTATLSQGRYDLAGAAAGNDVVFGGGQQTSVALSNVVDIFNTSTGSWSTATLSASRSLLAAAGAGNDVFFAGGDINNGSTDAAAVDIYNSSTDTWSTATLSQARSNLAAAVAGNNVYFAGGVSSTAFSNVVDIYNTSTGTWSTATLSQPREAFAAAGAGNYVVFAGGYVGNSHFSNAVDIYNASTNTWSTATLSESRANLAAAAVGNEVFFAGGNYDIIGDSSNVVDILNLPSYTTISSSSAYTLWLGTTVSGRMTLLNPGRLNLATFSLNVGSMSGNAPIDLGSGTLTMGSDNTNTTYAGNISDAGTLVKTGSGTLVLAGSNTYNGPTTVNQGKLTVDGSLTNSAVIVNSGGILSGTGSLTSVTAYAGGHLAPGDFNAGALILAGNMDFEGGELNVVGAGSSITSLSIAGDLSLNNDPTLNFSGSITHGTYTIASYSGTLNGSFGRLNIPAGDTISYGTGSNSAITISAVPEPSTLALLAAGALGLPGYAWRKRRRNAGQIG